MQSFKRLIRYFLLASTAILLSISTAKAEPVEYRFNFSDFGTGSFIYNDDGSANPIILDFGALGALTTDFDPSSTGSIFGSPPNATTSSVSGNLFPLKVGGVFTTRLRLKSSGVFELLNPDFSPFDPVKEGTYSMAPALSPEETTGTYTFGFSAHGTGTFDYDGFAEDIPLLQYDFGPFGSGSTDFGDGLTETVFGNPPAQSVRQENTFFSLSNTAATQYSFNFSAHGTGGYIYDETTQESSSFVLDFEGFGSFVGPIESSTINAIFGSPPNPSTSSSSGFYFALSEPGTGIRFFAGGIFCLENAPNNCELYGNYNLAPAAYGLRLNTDGTFCVRPDADVCGGGLPDLESGTYQISKLIPGEISTGTNVIAIPVVVDENNDPVVNPPEVLLTFDNVTDAGTGTGETTVTVLSSPPMEPLPPGIQFSETTTFLDIETPAGFTGSVEVCIGYDDTNINEETLELLHLIDEGEDAGEWEVITNPDSPDTGANILCGSTTSFSTFAGGYVASDPPISDAGADQTKDEGAFVTLDGSASENAVTYAWAQIAGPEVDFYDTDTANPTFYTPYVPSNTTLTFELIVNDDDGVVSEPDAVNVTVVSVNNAPIAVAAGASTIKQGAMGTLDATGSYDMEGDTPLLYSWTSLDVVLDLSDPALPTYIAPLEVGSTLTFYLVVSDGKEDSERATVIVEIVDNSPPVADAGIDLTVSEGGVLVVLDGTGSSDPDGGDSLSYNWTGPEALSGSSTSMPSFTTPFVGPGGAELLFDLQVDDDDYFSLSDTDQVLVTVLNLNDPPRCDLAQAVCYKTKSEKSGKSGKSKKSKKKGKSGKTKSGKKARRDCSILTRPNHKMVLVKIDGVSDPESGNVTLEITGVTQDEPTSGLGHGDSDPDAVLQGDDSVLIRRERDKDGNGRVYTIDFTASDITGESCNGSVQLSVPRKKKDPAIDDGQDFDSTQP